MADDIAIRVKNVNKTFRLPHEKTTSIKGAVVNFWRRDRTYEKQLVLNDVSFEIKKGEFFGIVGRNGSGKSTLLKMLAGIYPPSKGEIQINGKLTPFIELGVGFNPELSGRENVYLNGALLGFSRKEMTAMYKDIVDFAELERFMDQKLKNYSSGMQVRLAFSIAIRAKSDILLIDEVLAVGDAAFQTKCFDYFYELRKTETTVVFVSHDRGALERFCERGVLINEGKIVEQGSIQKVLKSYSKIVMEELEAVTQRDAQETREEVKSDYLEFTKVRACDEDNQPKKEFTYGEKIKIGYNIKFKKNIINPVIGVTIWLRHVDKAVFAVNTLTQGIKNSGNFKAGDNYGFNIELPPLLNDGEYYIEPAVANESATIFYEQQPKAATFFISGSNNPHAILTSDKDIKLTRG